ncbi:MAG: 3-hydroxyacyl-CoA dehydrogenase NAD-binding domain-containing protein, partial [Gaiellaceae bacterium]
LSATLDALAEGAEEPVVVEERPSTWEEVQAAVLEALADEAARMLDEGVVPEAADIDTCMILGAGWPVWLGGITKFLDQTGVSERVAGRTLGPAPARAAV